MIARRKVLQWFGLAATATVLPIPAPLPKPPTGTAESLVTTLTYRTSGPWGQGLSVSLRADEVDLNFYRLAREIERLNQRFRSLEVVGIGDDSVLPALGNARLLSHNPVASHTLDNPLLAMDDTTQLFQKKLS